MAANPHPYAGAGPGGERLLAAHLLLRALHEYPETQEGVVRQALQPMYAPDLEDYSTHDALLYAMLRTASYYVVDADQAHEAIASMPPALPSFPPLPFRRVWIETQRQERGRILPGMYATWQVDDESGFHEVVDVLGVAINEVQRGREWQLFLPFQRVREVEEPSGSIPLSRDMRTMAFHVTPHEILAPAPVGVTVQTWHQGHLLAMLQLALNGAHLITARSVPLREQQLPRAQRKRLGRERWAPSMPKLYYVDLAAAGEAEELRPGRTYHHRWLVSGHWRHIEGGDSLCTCWEHRHSPRVATYIEPYVKGPPGAPWIGRPVHRKR